MDSDDAVPPAIRRSPRAALEAQRRGNQHQHQCDDCDQKPNEAAPPPVSRSRSASLLDSSQSMQSRPRGAASSSISSLQARSAHLGKTPDRRHRFSHPFREQFQIVPSSSSGPSLVAPPSCRRRPHGLASYKNNSKFPLSSRRQPSLETIESVDTATSVAPSEVYLDPPEAEAPPPEYFTLEDDQLTTPTLTNITSNPFHLIPEDDPSIAPTPISPSSKPLSTNSSSGSSGQSPTPPLTRMEHRSLEHHSPKSLFRKMMPRMTEEPPPMPTQLIIERTVSFDRTSHRSGLSSSSTSLPPERPPISGIFGRERSQSGSSSEWSASSFNTSGLTEAEIKKCRKKGINPALYAEMKAARKGKWTSPIAGTTFL
ncbi:hypothetical protein BKA66DRAFT_216927 [Pyrenochaeta sp. MPI-SDFR-AT-0127]|nr:hypothetical protein BKA66DRAFT_216927 [Pyrenochaeta sp. MPI-SDFR-AT-0127]